MSRIYRRSDGGNWWGDWLDVNGKRHQRSLRTHDKSVAIKRLKEAEVGEAGRKRPKAHLLSDAIDYMIETTCHDKAAGTRSMYTEKGRRIISVLGDVDVNTITKDMLSGYIKTRLAGTDSIPKASPNTVNKELITIRRALNEAAERNLLVLPVAMLMPKFKAKYVPKERWLPMPEFLRLLAELEPHRALWASLAGLAGMRAGEVERLEWGMVDFAANEIRVPGTKTTGSRRRVPIAADLLPKLEAAPRLTKRVVEPWSNVRRDLHVACAAAGVDKVSPNDLRRSFASWLKQAGIDSAWVAALMGHSSTRMVDLVYGKLSQETLRQAMRSIPVTTSVGPTCHSRSGPGVAGPEAVDTEDE